MEEYIKHELVLLRASEPVGSDRYNELSNAIQWVSEHGDKQSPKHEPVDNDKFAFTTIEWKDSREKENVVIALFDNEEEAISYNDDDIFFYCSDKSEFERLKHFDNGEDFIVVGCTLFSETLY